MLLSGLLVQRADSTRQNLPLPPHCQLQEQIESLGPWQQKQVLHKANL